MGNNTAESCKVGGEGGRRSVDQTVRRARSRALIDNTRVRLHRSSLILVSDYCGSQDRYRPEAWAHSHLSNCFDKVLSEWGESEVT